MFNRTKVNKTFLIKIGVNVVNVATEVARISITSEKADDKIVNHAGNAGVFSMFLFSIWNKAKCVFVP